MMAISWEKKCENRPIPFSNRTGSYPGTLSLSRAQEISWNICSFEQLFYRKKVVGSP